MPRASVDDIAPPPAGGTASYSDIVGGGDLPHPDYVDQQTTLHAQTLAPIIDPAAAAEIANAPPPYAPHLPLALRTRENSPDLAAAADAQRMPGGMSPARTGFEAALNLDPSGVISGTGHAMEGLGQTVFGNGLRGRAAGVHKTIGGLFEAATPALPAAVAATPVKTAASLAAGMVSQTAIEAGLEKLGLPREYAAVAGDLGGILAGIGTHKAISSKALAAVKSRVSATLEARAGRQSAEQPTANSTGTEPYTPPPDHGTASAADIATPPTPGVRDETGGVVTTVRTPAGTKARVRYRIDEAKDLTTSFDGGDYNANFQPRNTDRLGSRQRVEQRKLDMDPEAMGYSRMAGDGAPITARNMAVTRNHGTQALKEIYAEDRPQAKAYRDFVTENAGLAGKTPEEVAAMKHPILHRELLENWDDPQIAKFAQEANASSTARMSDAEIAEQMAGKLSGAAMDAFHPNDDGVPNPEFVRGLIRDLPVEEQATFFDKNGEISQSGARLVRNAVFAKAYPNRSAIERMSESTDSNVRNITNGMLRSANDVAKMQEAIDRGDRYPLSISDDIGKAAAVIDDLRSNRKNVADWLNQGEFEARDPVLEKLVRIFSSEARRPKVIADTIRNYVDGVDRAGDPHQTSMFASEVPTKVELLGEAYDSARTAADSESARRQGAQGSLPVHRSGDGAEGTGANGPGDRGSGGEPEAAGRRPNGPPAEAASSDVGPHGPIFREYSGRPAEAIAKLQQEKTGEVPDVWRHPELGPIDLVWGDKSGGLDHIISKHVEGQQDLKLDDLARMIPDMRVVKNDGRTASLESPTHEAGVRLDYDGNTKHWLVTAYEKKEAAPPAGGSPVVSSSPQSAPQGDGHTPSGGSGSSVYLGSGLGAFEPFLRESIEDMRAMKAKRDAAIEELKRSEATPGEKDWGGQVARFFAGERDLWGARANQGIAKARKLTIGSRARSGPEAGVDTDAEAVSIMREFKGRPEELKSFLGGYHPSLLRIEDAAEYTRVMDRIQKLRPIIARAMAPDAAMKAVDAFYTEMARATADEGKRTGTLDETWNPETYVPHVLNKKGEGVFPGPRKAAVQMLGKIGKYFGFSQHRSYPTLLDAIANDVIPKTMNVHDAFTIQQDHFARSRATRLLEDQLRDTEVGKYTVKENAPEGWVPLAPEGGDEFVQRVPYPTGELTEEGEPVLDVAVKHLYVPEFIADALKPITAPDASKVIFGVDLVRGFQRATKTAQLGLSFFHAVTENYMALANMGPKGWAKALFVADRDSPEFLAAERDLIAHGGTTAIQGHTVEAYTALSPGSIPTYREILRRAPVVRQVDELARAISELTFGNVQRRFKVTDYQLHLAAWMEKHPEVWGRDLAIAKQSIAKEVNAVYGGLQWETLDRLPLASHPGINKMSVEMARAIMLAPDWTISNIFNLKYAAERGTPAGRLARMFWIRTIVGGLAATQAASLMFSRGQMSRRLTMVYMGKDANGEDVFQNIFFKGASGDVLNLILNIHDYGAQGIVRSMAGKAAPAIRTVLQLKEGRDYLGREIAPKGMSGVAQSVRTVGAAAKSLAPVPFSVQNMWDMLMGPEAHKYTMPEYFTTMFAGNPPAHVPPAGTHMTHTGLRPNAPREENSVMDQLRTGKVYKRRAR